MDCLIKNARAAAQGGRAAADEMVEEMLGYSSTERPQIFVQRFARRAVNEHNGEIFWRVLHEEWTGFDSINHAKIVGLFTKFRPTWSADFLLPEDRAFYDALPDTITAYRGQHATRDGIAWTTDRAMALWFANGGRFRGRGHVPTLVTAEIPKALVAGAYANRRESEIVLFCLRERSAHDPNGIKVLSKVEPTPADINAALGRA